MSTTNRLAGKTAVVTGSSSGLGRAIALLYAKEGAQVVCADLRPNARLDIGGEAEIDTHELIQKSAGKAIYVKTDASDAGQMESLVKRAIKEYGRLDVFVTPLYFSRAVKDQRG
jgi:NAD(P)-dependent dehydrogenase (short-subunit alcohol dehydrogenase family)